MNLLILWIIGWYFCLGFYDDVRLEQPTSTRRVISCIILFFAWPFELGFTLGKLYDKMYNK